MSSDTDIWEVPGAPWPPLPDDEVHVWRVCVSRTEPRLAELEPLLAPEEATRAARFKVAHGRLTFTLGRGLLRVLLGNYVGQPPTALQFTTNAHGKPALLPGPGDGGLQFNLSHSGDWLVYAVTRGRAVGIDVERMRLLTTLTDLARRFFAPREVAQLLALPQGQRQEAFFHCWARKEAYIKAVGRGLNIPLDQFEVSLVPGESARLVAASEEAAVPGPWGMQALTVAVGYAAAIAVQGSSWRLRCWEGAFGL